MAKRRAVPRRYIRLPKEQSKTPAAPFPPSAIAVRAQARERKGLIPYIPADRADGPAEE